MEKQIVAMWGKLSTIVCAIGTSFAILAALWLLCPAIDLTQLMRVESTTIGDNACKITATAPSNRSVHMYIKGPNDETISDLGEVSTKSFLGWQVATVACRIDGDKLIITRSSGETLTTASLETGNGPMRLVNSRGVSKLGEGAAFVVAWVTAGDRTVGKLWVR